MTPAEKDNALSRAIGSSISTLGKDWSSMLNERAVM
jgi:hypothetical protein